MKGSEIITKYQDTYGNIKTGIKGILSSILLESM